MTVKWLKKKGIKTLVYRVSGVVMFAAAAAPIIDPLTTKLN